MDAHIIRNRILTVLFLFIFFYFLVFLRLVDLQVIRHDFLLGLAVEQRKKIITLAADRGDIFDRSERLFATSIDSASIYIIPDQIKNKQIVAERLSRLSGVTFSDILNKMYEKKSFVWLVRQIDEKKAETVKKAKLPGVFVLSEKSRIYPRDSIAAQVIGFVGLDNEGLSGIELGLDKYLRGEEGRVITESDPRGREILGAYLRKIKTQAPGLNVYLTIDETIQYIAEKEIEKAVRKYRARSGTVVVMDPKTGEILALASKPDFNPNDYKQSAPEKWKPRFIADVYEPGSTFKLITVAAGLNEGIIKPDSRIYCPDSLEVGGRIIKNSHTMVDVNKNMTPSEILMHSINTGAAKIGMELGKDRYMRYIKAFGFGKRTDIGFFGESKGILKETRDWARSDLAMIAFGQTIAVTPIQLVSAVAAIANDGIAIKPILIKKIEAPDGSTIKNFTKTESRQIISKKTSEELKKMMEDVVVHGTGRYASINGFSVGGKTGTAQKIRPDGSGYWAGHYIPSFVGIAPLSDPRLVILVVVDDPQEGNFWGESVAAPVFKNVAEEALRYLNVAPDLLKS